MKKTFLYAIGATAITLGSLAIFTPESLAYRGDPTKVGPNYTAERHEAMEKAFENNDYNSWKSLMNGRGRVTQVINEKNFSQFAKAHELAEQGKTAEANKIRQSLGLGLQNGQGYRSGGRYQSL